MPALRLNGHDVDLVTGYAYDADENGSTRRCPTA